MAGESVLVVHGLDQLVRDFGKLSKKAKRGLQKQLRKLAEPAAEEIRRDAEAHGFSAATVAGIRPGTRRGGAVVRQIRRKTTGARPDFGGIQFRYAFIPGADTAEPIVEHGVEEWLGQITAECGLGMGGITL